MQISIAWHRFEWADADSAIELVAFGYLVFVFVYFSIFFFACRSLQCSHTLFFCCQCKDAQARACKRYIMQMGCYVLRQNKHISTVVWCANNSKQRKKNTLCFFFIRTSNPNGYVATWETHLLVAFGANKRAFKWICTHWTPGDINPLEMGLAERISCRLVWPSARNRWTI